MPSYTQDEYHKAVTDTLKAIDWQREVGFYPDDKTPLDTPSIYFSVDSWSRANRGTDQLHIDMDCSIWVVVSRSLVCSEHNPLFDSPELYTRSLAADISQLVEGHNFGLEIEPATFQSATMDNFDRGLIDYYVWRISYGQTLPIGRDLHDFYRPPLKQIYVSKAPDIGIGHEDDYDPMFPETLPDE
ncbi:hypothetical protein HAX39_25035 [Citrobacter freundii]|nr:hypothetical protein [Citrobacter freundii]